jgi:hypothetical protein
MKRLLALLLIGCGPHDVELVNFPGGRPPQMRICNENSDCTGDELCDKPECGDVQGRCVPRNLCMPLGGPVCGCDNQTYANNCERKAAGIASFIPGACQ